MQGTLPKEGVGECVVWAKGSVSWPVPIQTFDPWSNHGPPLENTVIYVLGESNDLRCPSIGDAVERSWGGTGRAW